MMSKNTVSETTCDSGARIGVYVCRCGLNIAQTVDCEKVAKCVEGVEGVVVAKHIPYACSEPGQMEIREDIAEHDLDRVVIGSCSPGFTNPRFAT